MAFDKKDDQTDDNASFDKRFLRSIHPKIRTGLRWKNGNKHNS